MAKNVGSGDVLARGGIRARFGPPERKMTDKQFDAMFEGFDPEKFKKNGLPKVAGDKKETNRTK